MQRASELEHIQDTAKKWGMQPPIQTQMNEISRSDRLQAYNYKMDSSQTGQDSMPYEQVNSSYEKSHQMSQKVKHTVKTSPKRIIKAYNTNFKLDLVRQGWNKQRPCE